MVLWYIRCIVMIAVRIWRNGTWKNWIFGPFDIFFIPSVGVDEDSAPILTRCQRLGVLESELLYFVLLWL